MLNYVNMLLSINNKNNINPFKKIGNLSKFSLKTVNVASNIFILPKQTMLLFNKKKYGLFKTTSYIEKKIKQKLITVSNTVKNNNNLQKKNLNLNKRKPKIIFYKKLDKFFYRDGRVLLMKKLNIKKYLIQKFVTKKIYNLIKKPCLFFMFNNAISDTLVTCNLFYTTTDACMFIKSLGVYINKSWNYNPHININKLQIFSIVSSIFILKFFKKKKAKIINHFKKIKFYKYRSKLFKSKKQFTWVASQDWLKEYSFVYTNKLSNIEFDWKTMSGVLLYDSSYINQINTYKMLNISMYMTRSYNWKYLT